MNPFWPLDWDRICRRAGGRRRYNAMRKRRKQQRRAEIIWMLAGKEKFWGVQAALAEVLGVSRATICRDFKAIGNAYKGALLS
jgi:hypothetical protein